MHGPRRRGLQHGLTRLHDWGCASLLCMLTGQPVPANAQLLLHEVRAWLLLR